MDVGNQLRKALQHLLCTDDISRLLAAGPRQQLETLDTGDQLPRVDICDRHNLEFHILEHFHVDAAKTEHQQRTDAGIGRHTHDGFPAPAGHFLNQDTGDLFPFDMLQGGGIYIFPGLAQRGFIADIQLDAARV